MVKLLKKGGFEDLITGFHISQVEVGEHI